MGGESLEGNTGGGGGGGGSRGGVSRKGAVQVLTVSAIEAFVSEGVTPEELMGRVVLPLPGTAVEYPTNEVKEKQDWQ